MADDWQVGDLALCLKLGRWNYSNTGGIADGRGMRAGVVATVRDIDTAPNGILTLWFEGYPGDLFSDGYGAIRFRKIRPHQPDEQDAETIRLLTTAPAIVEA